MMYTLLFLSCAFKLLTRLGPLLRREQGTITPLSVGAEPLLRGACRSTAKKDILCVTRQRGQQDRNGRVRHLLTIWEAKGKGRWRKSLIIWVSAPAVLLVTPEQHSGSCKEPSKLSISLVFPKQIYHSGICIHCFAFVYLLLSAVDCAFLGPFRIFPLWASISSGRKGCLQTRPHPDVHAVLTFSPVNPVLYHWVWNEWKDSPQWSSRTS